MKPIKIIVFAFVLLLAACTELKDAMEYANIGPVAAKPAKTYVYECADDYTFTASIKDNHAWLFLPEQTLQLPQVITASGAKYSAKQTSLWTKGDEARLETGAIVRDGCKNNRAKAIWEHAKLTGVDFRALGNEPSWVLEIIQGETIIFAHFYDKIDKYQFSRPEPEVDSAKQQTTYNAENAEHTLKITIIGKACQDTMSGESFASTVSVELDGILFSGCGRALH